MARSGVLNSRQSQRGRQAAHATKTPRLCSVGPCAQRWLLQGYIYTNYRTLQVVACVRQVLDTLHELQGGALDRSQDLFQDEEVNLQEESDPPHKAVDH